MLSTVSRLNLKNLSVNKWGTRTLKFKTWRDIQPLNVSVDIQTQSLHKETWHEDLRKMNQETSDEGCWYKPYGVWSKHNWQKFTPKWVKNVAKTQQLDQIKPPAFNGSMSWTLFYVSVLRPWQDTATGLTRRKPHIYWPSYGCRLSMSCIASLQKQLMKTSSRLSCIFLSPAPK